MMQNNNVLESSQIPHVAMAKMNEVHREELDIVNSINNAICAKDVEKVTHLCQQWWEHTQAHFERENGFMQTYNFPAFHCHHTEHENALQTLDSVIKAWQENQDLTALSAYVTQTWPDWYINHISTMDTVTSAYIKQCIENE